MKVSLFKVCIGAALGALIAAAPVSEAMAQSVDRFEFLQLRKRVDKAETELNQIGNAVRGADTFDQIEGLRREIQRLTGDLERLQARQRQFEDQTKAKLEDFEYRIVVLEGGDPSTLFAPEQPATGGEAAGQGGGTLGTLNLEAEGVTGFDVGMTFYQDGRFTEAAERLAKFAAENPGDPRAGEALYWRGEALSSAGDTRGAAKAWLDTATLHPDSLLAPDALVRLGGALSALGQRQQACATFRQVGTRYPAATEAVVAARSEAARAGCG